VSHLLSVEQVTQLLAGTRVGNIDDELHPSHNFAVIVLEGTDLSVEGRRRTPFFLIRQIGEEFVACQLVGQPIKVMLDIAQCTNIVEGCTIGHTGDCEVVGQPIERSL